jgi:uncharacterized protein DUF4154
MLSRRSCMMALAATFLVSARGQIDEYQVKARFLGNFAKYVEWPSESFKSANDPIVICILGNDPFGGALDQAVDGKEVAGRRFLVRPISNVPPDLTCHILFVPASERKRFRSMAASIENSAILTVGEIQGFPADGGVINFGIEDGRVRFEINPEAAGRKHLRISSRLLSLARSVKK